MKSSTVQLRKSQRETNYTLQNEHSIDSLASNFSYKQYLSICVIYFIHFWNYAANIVITCKSVGKRSCTFITVIMQIRIFSLNLGISNKKFETTKYSLEKSFQKE